MPSGKLFKTVRHDELDFWNELIWELLKPSIEKPEYRKGARKAYTVKLVNGQYKIVPTEKTRKRSDPDEAYNIDDKKAFSRHQSTSYANPAEGYRPPYFGHSAARSDLLMGLSFDPSDCQLKRIMLYDNGTIKRPYDFDTVEEAQAFISEKLKAQEYHATLESLQIAGLKNGSKRHNEVMAKLRWTERCAITVFSNNLESRLLAQVRALDLKNRLIAQQKPNDVTITLYPDFVEYTDAQKEQDIRDATISADPTIKKYINALRFLSNSADIAEITSDFESWIQTRILIQKTNPQHIGILIEKVRVACQFDPVLLDLPSISATDLLVFLKSLSDAQFDVILKSICSFFQEMGMCQQALILKNIPANQCKIITKLVDVDMATYFLMKSANINTRKAFCEALIEKMPKIQISAHCFSALMSCATDDLKDVIYAKMKSLLISLINDFYDIYYVLENLTEPQCNEAIDLIYEKVVDLVRLPNEARRFNAGFKNIPVQYQIKIYDFIKNELIASVKNVNDFEDIFSALSDSLKDDFFLSVKSKLTTVGFFTAQSLDKVFKLLSCSQSDSIFDCIKNNIITLIRSSKDITFVNSALSDRQFEEFYTVIIKIKLPTLVVSKGLAIFLCDLSNEKSRIMLNALKDIILSKINTFEDFKNFFYCLSIYGVQQTCVILKDKIPGFFDSVSKLECVLGSWANQTKAAVVEFLKNDLLDMLDCQTMDACQAVQVAMEKAHILYIIQDQLNERREKIVVSLFLAQFPEVQTRCHELQFDISTVGFQSLKLHALGSTSSFFCRHVPLAECVGHCFCELGVEKQALYAMDPLCLHKKLMEHDRKLLIHHALMPSSV